MAFVVLMAPAVVLMVRAPEDLGLRPDGDAFEETAEESRFASQPQEVNFTREEAVRTVQFWLIVIAGLNRERTHLISRMGGLHASSRCV